MMRRELKFKHVRDEYILEARWIVFNETTNAFSTSQWEEIYRDDELDTELLEVILQGESQ